MRWLSLIRLLPAVLLLLTASLAVVPAPTHLLWIVQVGVTEWGHVLTLICLAIALPLWSSAWTGKLAFSLCIAAAVLALTPVFRAMRVARDLPDQMTRAFAGKALTTSPPLSAAKLFRGLTPPAVHPETIVYKTGAGANLTLDFYPSQIRKRSPLIIVIHGGSWGSGDNKDFIPMDQHLAGRGFAVADVLYRLAPAAQFPAPCDDVRAAIAHLRASADRLNIDPDRVVLLGRSAGAQIALSVAYTNEPFIRGVISFYAPTDMFWSWDHPGNPLVIDSKTVLTNYLGGTPATSPGQYTASSPVRTASAKSPPTLLLHGDRDELVSPFQSAALSQRLSQLGVANLNIELPWATHGFDYILRGPGGQISAYAIESFLNAVV